jgi:hypothetical protein
MSGDCLNVPTINDGESLAETYDQPVASSNTCYVEEEESTEVVSAEEAPTVEDPVRSLVEAIETNSQFVGIKHALHLLREERVDEAAQALTDSFAAMSTITAQEVSGRGSYASLRLLTFGQSQEQLDFYVAGAHSLHLLGHVYLNQTRFARAEGVLEQGRPQLPNSPCARRPSCSLQTPLVHRLPSVAAAVRLGG